MKRKKWMRKIPLYLLIISILYHLNYLLVIGPEIVGISRIAEKCQVTVHVMPPYPKLGKIYELDQEQIKALKKLLCRTVLSRDWRGGGSIDDTDYHITFQFEDGEEYTILAMGNNYMQINEGNDIYRNRTLGWGDRLRKILPIEESE